MCIRESQIFHTHNRSSKPTDPASPHYALKLGVSPTMLSNLVCTAASVVPKFNISDMEGMWYITRGLSEEFDTYNCQVCSVHIHLIVL